MQKYLEVNSLQEKLKCIQSRQSSKYEGGVEKKFGHKDLYDRFTRRSWLMISPQPSSIVSQAAIKQITIRNRRPTAGLQDNTSINYKPTNETQARAFNLARRPLGISG